MSDPLTVTHKTVELYQAASKQLLSKCRQLSALRLDRTIVHNDTDLIALVHHQPHLRSIDLSGCGALTGAGLRQLAQACPQLESIDLSNCSQLTAATLTALAEHCPNLKQLSIGGWRGHIDLGIKA